MKHFLACLTTIVGLSLSFVATPAFAQAEARPTLYMIGDSTMANKPVIPANAERGWGQMLPGFFKDTLRIENYAVNGRSTKSFRADGRWTTITNKLKAGDWVIIQFGHNDEKVADTNRYTEAFGSFKTNLTRYITETRAAGAKPILATSVARRAFHPDGSIRETHGEYIIATRQVAEEQKVPLLELNTRSTELLKVLGPERSKKLYLWVGLDEFPQMPKAREDDTHFCAYGATRICDVAVDEIKKNVPELVKYLNTGK